MPSNAEKEMKISNMTLCDGESPEKFLQLRSNLTIQFIILNSNNMDQVRCPTCSSNYSDQQREGRLPRVLITCGHTFCQSCIASGHVGDRVICFQCKKVSIADDASNFPVNLELMKMVKSHQTQLEHLCKTHRKKLEVYCDKQKQLICLECLMSTHSHHKTCLISQKVQTDRTILKESIKRIGQGYQESRKAVQKLSADETYLESCFLDLSMEISIFYKQIIQTVNELQKRQEQNLKKEKQAISKQIQQYKNEALQRQKFHEQLQLIYKELQQASDIQFIQRQNQQSFLLNSSKSKRQKYIVPNLEFKRVGSLQEAINQLQQMAIFQKKKIIHSNSASMANKDVSAMHGSPSLKKQQKQPAVLQVNLSEEYNRRKANMPKQTKKIKPAKKVISISTDKQKDKVKEKQMIIQAITSGRNIVTKDGKTDLKFIRQSSIKKNKDQESLLYDELEMSQNFTPLSMNSFMRTSRESQVSLVHLNDSSIKHSFNSFTLLETQEKIFHFGGRTQSTIEKYSKDNHYSQQLNTVLHRKYLQIVHHKPYSHDKCLVFGGVSNMNDEPITQIYQFNFKTERLGRTIYNMPKPRLSFGCISKEDSLYIIGGKHQKALNSFQRWDFGMKEIQITKLGNMGQTRQDLGCCLGYDGYIYVAGGVNASNNILNSCQRYNWNKKAWETVPSMNRQRRGLTLIALPHGIMAIGGHSRDEALPYVQLLDFNRWQWIELAPLSQPRCFHSALVSKDYQNVTVFGGFANKNDLDSIQVYDIESNSWSICGRMKQRRCMHVSIQSP